MAKAVLKKSARLHRKAKHRVFSENLTQIGVQPACNPRATHRYFRRFQAYPSCILNLQKSYMYKGFLSILSKEKTGLENPDFWCESS